MNLRSFRAALCAVTLLGFFVAAHAQAADPIAQTLQQSFIWRGVTETSAGYTVFRKTFSAPDASVAKLHIFADARYVVWINGQYVSRGPCRFDPDGPEYDTLDVTPFLTTGSNTIAVMAMSYPAGTSATSGKMIRHAPGLTALLTAGSGASAVSVGTNTTWKWKTGLRYKAPGIGWGFINDTVDAQLYDGDWTQTAYVDTAWTAAAAISGTQWGTLRARSTPLLKEQDVAVQQGASFPLTLTGSNAVYFTLPRMVQGYFEIDVESAAAGSSLKLEVGEKGSASSISSTYSSAFNYTAATGRRKCFNVDSMGFRYLRVTNTAGTLTLHGLRVVDRRYPYTDAGSFTSSDAWLNDLWGRAVHTIRMCSDDGYMDCTLRERAEWMGDAAVVEYPVSRVTLAGPAVAGQPLRSDSGLMKNLIRHVAQSANQYNDGRLKAHTPSDRNDIHGYIEDYSCLWVQTVRQVYENTGDLDLVNEVWPQLAAQMQWFLDRRSAARGLVRAREFVIFDNPLKYVTCEGATLNAFVYRALLDAAILGDATGRSAEAANYRAAATTLQANFNQHLWDATNSTYIGGLDANGAVQTLNSSGTTFSPTSTGHAAMIALDRGIVPADRVEAVRAYFLSKYSSAVTYPYTAFWALENLYAIDTATRDTEALNYIRSKWTTMMNITDTGTFTESFGGGEPCHNFGASAAYFLSAYVLGVRMDGPASGGRILIEPRFGNLASAQGNVVTELGVVPVSWSKTGSSLDMAFTVPTGATATVRVPQLIAGAFPAVEIDGQPPASTTTDGRYVVFNAGAGVHQVKAFDFLKWKGNGTTNLWDAATTSNWLSSLGTATTFSQASNAIFDDSGSNSPAVSLVGVLSPGRVIVDAGKNFTLSGTGSLDGAMSLTKSGTGTLTISTANTFSGGAVLNAGTLAINGNDALGLGGDLVFNGGTLAISANVNTLRNFRIEGSASASIDTRGFNMTHQGSIEPLNGAAGGLTKSGAGTLTLSGSLSYVGPTVITGGTLKLGSIPMQPSVTGLIYRLDASDVSTLSLSGTKVTGWSDAAGGAVAFTQATATKQPTLVSNGLNGKPIVRFSGGQQLLLTASSTPREIFAVTIVKSGVDGNIGGFLGINNADTGLRLNSSPGSWAADGGLTTVNGVATTSYTANQAHLVHRYGTSWGTWSATGFGQYFNGGTTRFYNGDVAEVLVYNRALTVAERDTVRAYLNAKWLGIGSLPPGVLATLPPGTAVTVGASGAVLDLSGANQTVASLAGVAGTTVANNGSLLVGDNATTTFSGVISGTGSLTKQGGGMLVFTGSNTFTGLTLASEGTLRVDGSLTGPVTVQSGATLTGTGSFAGNVTNNGTVRLTGGAALKVAGTFTNNGLLDIMTGAQTLPANFVNNGIVLDRGAVHVTSAAKNGSDFTVTITGYTGHSYQFQRTGSLSGPWTNIGSPQTGTGIALTFTDIGGATGTHCFYRIFVQP